MKILKNKKVIWEEEDYKAAVRELRADKRFIGFDANKGFNLRDVSKISSRKKKDIKQAIATRQYLDLREKTDMLVYYAPKSKVEKRAMQKDAGYTGDSGNDINLKHVKHIPIIKPPHVAPENIRVSYDRKTGITDMQYKKDALQIMHVPIDFGPIFSNMDFEMEEEELTDSFTHMVTEQMFAKLGHLNDGNSVFRLSTFAGDLDATRYGSYRILEAAITKLAWICEEYFDPAKKNGGIMVNSVSVYRRMDNAEMNNAQLDIAESSAKPSRRKWAKK